MLCALFYSSLSIEDDRKRSYTRIRETQRKGMILGIIRLGNGDYISPEHLKFIEMSLRIRCLFLSLRRTCSNTHTILIFYSTFDKEILFCASLHA